MITEKQDVRSQDYASETIQKILNNLKASKAPLNEILGNNALYLPDGYAAKVSEATRNTNTTQMRKIFGMVEKAFFVSRHEERFSEAQEMLFMVVPQVAYSKGRGLIQPWGFSDLLQECINEYRIKSSKDIETMFRFMQSIVAYRKK